MPGNAKIDSSLLVRDTQRYESCPRGGRWRCRSASARVLRRASSRADPTGYVGHGTAALSTVYMCQRLQQACVRIMLLSHQRAWQKATMPRRRLSQSCSISHRRMTRDGVRGCYPHSRRPSGPWSARLRPTFSLHGVTEQHGAGDTHVMVNTRGGSSLPTVRGVQATYRG